MGIRMQNHKCNEVENAFPIFSERELMFMFAICRRPSVCLSVCRLSSVTFVNPTQAIEIFGNVSTPFGTLAICDPSVKKITEIVPEEPLRRGVKPIKRCKKCNDFGPFQGYISETVQDRR